MQEFAKAIELDKSLAECIDEERDTLQDEMQLAFVVRLARRVLADHAELYAKARNASNEKASAELRATAAAMFSEALDSYLSQCSRASQINTSRPIGLHDVLAVMTRVQGVLMRELQFRLPEGDAEKVVQAIREEVRIPGTAETYEQVEPPARIAAFMDQTVPNVAEAN